MEEMRPIIIIRSLDIEEPVTIDVIWDTVSRIQAAELAGFLGLRRPL
jgi:hypothetical protein